MCGIAGFSCKESQGNNYLLESLKALSHRGPDSKGFHLEENQKVGLAHTRLAIQDISDLGIQPMQNKNLIITFNGEIYNHLKIRKNLIKKGYTFRSCSDTETLLTFFQDELINKNSIESILNKLDGIFAFAIWDKITKELYICRDNFGIKPIYYIEDKDQNSLFFASEIKALKKTIKAYNKDYKDLLDIVNLNIINEHLRYIWSPNNKGLLKQIKKIDPGEYIIVKDGQITNKISWYRNPFLKKSEPTSHYKIKKKESIEAVRNSLRNAVHKQMLSDVEVGVMLSGGLDSSAIVAFASEVKSNIPCFTIRLESPESDGFVDDLKYARKVSSHFSLPLHEINVSPTEFIESLPEMVHHLDEPIADPAAINLLFICSQAKKKNVKVLLSGIGGDDLFTGYRRHKSEYLYKTINNLPEFLKNNLFRFSKTLNSNNLSQRKLKRFLSLSQLNNKNRILEYYSWINHHQTKRLFSDKSLKEFENLENDEPMHDFLNLLPRELNNLERMLALEQRFFLAMHNLNYVDKMSMAHGIEVRVPFLDKHLVETAADVPINYKQRGLKSKWVLKKALEGYLPKEIIYRPKTGFGLPLRSWINNELEEYIRDLLSKDNIENRGIFNYKEIDQLIKSNKEGTIDAGYTILTLICLELWFKEYID